VSAEAATPDADISPRWMNVNSIKLNMSLDNKEVTSNGTVTGYSGTTYISATFSLEKLIGGQYQPVDTWYASTATMLLSSSYITSNCTAGSYRLSVSGTATRNGIVEPFSDWLIKTL
jgi:hypothetical protein